MCFSAKHFQIGKTDRPKVRLGSDPEELRLSIASPLQPQRPIVEIDCIGCSSESWEPQPAPTPWHSRAGGGAVHSIRSGLRTASRFLVHESDKARSDNLTGVALTSLGPAEFTKW
jgi:hypothetical protein